MNKEINIDNTLSNIINEYPALLDILYDCGFTQIKIPGMLQTAGRFMTLRSGCELRKIDITFLNENLLKFGFKLQDKSM